LSRLRWHATETNDYPGLPRIAERHRVARASYLLRQPNTREADRLCSGADEGAGCPGRGRARNAVGWPGEMHPYRLSCHGAIRLLELLSGVREDHPKVVLE
jgi:hypothetical protein